MIYGVGDSFAESCVLNMPESTQYGTAPYSTMYSIRTFLADLTFLGIGFSTKDAFWLTALVHWCNGAVWQAGGNKTLIP